MSASPAYFWFELLEEAKRIKFTYEKGDALALVT